VHQPTPPPRRPPPRNTRQRVPARVRAGLVVPPEHWPLIRAGVDVRPRYRVTDPDTGELVERRARVRRVPAVSASSRVLSVARLDRNARRVARQARAAARHGRAVEWLAAAMYGLDRYRPPGARRADARHHVALVAAAAAAVADFGTGRHSMPGLQDTAAQTGLSERTVTRHWAVLARLGLLRLDERGRWLLAGERAELEADPDERNRWRNRAEWTLLVPSWVREVGDAELAPWLARARAVLGMIVDPDAPATHDHPPPAADPGSVYPPSGYELVSYLPVQRSTFSQRAAAAHRRRHRRARPPGRPGGRAEAGAASRPSPTRRVRREGRRAMAPEAVALARQLAADGRIPWLADSPRYMLAATLQRLAERGWTVDDLIEQTEQTLRERGWTRPQWVIAPAKYLAVLLRDADPDRPPAATRRAAAAAHRDELAAHHERRRAERRRRDARAVPGHDHPEVQRFRAQLRARATSPAPAPPPAAAAPARAPERSSASIHAAALDRARRERRERHRRDLGLPDR